MGRDRRSDFQSQPWRLHNPFPRQPKGIHFVPGHLHFDPKALPSRALSLGKSFVVSWDCARGSLSVFHNNQPDRALWATSCGAAFVSAALGESTIHESQGSISLEDRVVGMLCTHQTIEDIATISPLNLNNTSSLKFQQQSTTTFSSIDKCNPDGRSTCLGSGIAATIPDRGSAVDADGTVVDDTDGDVVVITGYLYTDCKLAQQELRLRHHGACNETMLMPKEKTSWFGSWFGSYGAAARKGIRVCYRMVFTEKRDHQLGFKLELDDLTNLSPQPTNVQKHRILPSPMATSPVEQTSATTVPLTLHQLPKWDPQNEIPQNPSSWLWSVEPQSAFRSSYHRRRYRFRDANPYNGYGLLSNQRHPRLLRKTTSSSMLEHREPDDDEDDTNFVLPRLNRVMLTYSSHRDERFFGFGEQFSYFDMKGKRVPIMVQEQGLGRGDQPITAAANLVSYRSGGDWHTTYAPSPHYITSDMNSIYLEGYEHSIFDLTQHDCVQVQVHAGSMKGRILHGHTPAELIKQYTAAIGRMRELPAWITKGAIVGMQGGHDVVRNVWQKLEDYDVPLSAFWLQDWVGQRKTSIGWQLWWNWEVDRDHYPGWEKLVADLDSCGVRTMTYCNPFIVPTDEKTNRQLNLFDDAKEEGYIVADTSGAPYMIPNTSFEAAIVDLTNPDTRKWLKGIMYDMVKTGVRGWMADFGESLPFDSCLFSGEDPAVAHNRYPEMWAELNREFVEEWEQEQRNSKQQGRQIPPAPIDSLQKQKADNEEDDDDKLVFFMRAGYRGSPRWATLFWAGDQMVSWQRHDGIKSAVTGLLTSGISGYAFNHSDIGGYCTVDLPFLRYQRSEELLLRWMELNAFSVIFRTHEGNVPGTNAQFYSNERTLVHFARCAKLYKAWEFYRRQLVKEAATTGMPVIRHLFLHYPHDKHVHSIVYEQFLVGSEILIVPVLDKAHTRVQAYFPSGDSWEHVWTGQLYRAPTKQGLTAWVQAPLGFPAVFVKQGSWVGAQYTHNLIKEGILKLTR